jgi:nucleotide-binding universal stress UspA family protein
LGRRRHRDDDVADRCGRRGGRTVPPASAEPSALLAAARATVAAHTSRADVVLVAREGDPAEELLEVARAASADLVIVGRRSEDVGARTRLGSVATRVVEQAPCDVLVVA